MKRLLVVLLFMLTGWAQGKPESHVQASLVSGLKTAVAGQDVPLALHLKMDKGWHVYWKYAGAAGYAPRLTWTLPPGVTVLPIQFPYPERDTVAGLVGYVYNDEVYFPVTLKVGPQVKSPLHLKVKAEWLACEKTCIPGEAELTLELPLGSAPEVSSEGPAVQAAQQKLPLSTGVIASLTPHGELSFSSELVKGAVEKAEFFPDQADLIDENSPQTFANNTLHVKFPKEKTPAAVTGVLVLKAGQQVLPFEVNMKVAAGSTPPPVAVAAHSYWVELLGAFVGGLILNLMPCVFPVLSLKVLGLVEQSAQEHHKPYKNGLVFGVGVLLSFWALAGMLLGLRSAGEKLGWGFQLQSPAFVAVMICLFFGIALNLLGVFEVGEGLTRLGELGQGKTGYADDFWSGVLATAVATPCSAPFMGSAVGYAVTLPAAQAMLIFTSLGLGMAAPYVFFTSFPALLRYLPRPGVWMETFKQAMAFPMLLTMVWFLYVLGAQTGTMGMFFALLALVALGFAGWMLGRWGWDPRSAGVRMRARWGSGLLALATVGMLITHLPAGGSSAAPANDGIAWESFSPERLAAARAKGPVFIDFTADWCLSCKANEAVTLRNAAVQKRMREAGVVALKADWTSRDEVITKTLAGFGRSGVPLYVYYPKGGEAVVLPEVISPGIVLDALK